jgi:beta-glucanase (GH16 family)
MRSNAVESNNSLSLILSEGQNGYVGAEFRSNMKFSYGYYSVSMKAASCSGVISSFFIYTGWPWDEIDIEFLGNDTTKVQFNYYTNGVGGHEYVYDLGFDASKEYHEYGFDWQEDSITWYVDGVAVYRATESIPSHAANIMMNIWNVADEHAGWAGKFYGSGLPVSAQYQWIGYQSAQ